MLFFLPFFIFLLLDLTGSPIKSDEVRMKSGCIGILPRNSSAELPTWGA